MPSLQPEVVSSNPESSVSQTRLSLAVVLVPLLASIVGNIVQLTGAANERRESQAKIEGLQAESRNATARLEQERKESSERLAQTWLEQLRKFDSLDDRALVLNAAVSTTSDERVRAWAQAELVNLKAELEKQKLAAQVKLNAPPSTVSVAVAPTGVKPGDAPANGGSQLDTAPQPRRPAPTMTSRQAAGVELVRISKAELMLRDAEKRLGSGAAGK